MLYEKFAKLMIPTLNEYGDRASRLAASSLVGALVKHHPQDCAAALGKSLVAAKATVIASYPNYTAAYASFDWAATLLTSASSTFADGSAEWTGMTSLLGALLAYLCGPKVNPKLVKKVTGQFARLLVAVPELADRFLAAGCGATATAEELVLCSKVLLTSKTATPEQTTALTDLYVKSIVPEKTATPTALIIGATGVLKYMSHDAFAGKLVDAIKRSLKRSPTIAVPAAATILEGVELDLSKHAATLSACIVEHVKSTAPEIRQSAVQFVAAAHAKTSDSEAATVWLTALIDLLNGKGGRLTLPEQKSAALTCIAGIATAPIPNVGKAALATTTITHLVAFASKEPKDDTVVEALATMLPFIHMSTPEHDTIPKEFVAELKKVLTGKKYASAVRAGYLRCVCAAYQGDRLKGGIAIFPDVLKYVEAAKSPQLVGDVAECSAGATFVLDMATTDKALAEKIKVWPMFKAASKGWAKLASESAEIVMVQMRLLNLVFGQFQKTLTTASSITGWIESFVSLATHPSYPVRSAVLAEGTAILAAHVSPKLRDQILAHFFVVVGEVSEALVKDPDAAPPTSGLVPAFMTLAGTTCAGDDARSFVTGLVVSAHHPLLMVLGRGSSKWIQMVESRGIDLGVYLTDDAEAVATTILESASATPTAASEAVKTISGLYEAQVVRERFLAFVFEQLENKAMQKASKKDLAIAATEAGKTYEEARKEASVLNNILEELASLSQNSKDYEEKKWELTVKRDLELKKRATGGFSSVASSKSSGGKAGAKVGAKAAGGGAKLNKHDADRRAATLKEEHVVREKVAALKSDAVNTCMVLRGMTQACPQFLTAHVAALVSALMKSMHSSVFAKDACALVTELGAVTSPALSGVCAQVGYALLRTASPAEGSIPTEWMKDPIDTLVARAMRALWGVTNDADPLDMASFSYCWPLVEYILIKSTAETSVLEDALVFLSSHAYLGAQGDAPRSRIVDLLMHVLHVHDRFAHQSGVFLATFCGEMAKTPGIPPRVLDAMIYGLQSSMLRVRRACLDGLGKLSLPREQSVATGLWIVCHDVDDTVKAQALELWQSQGFEGFSHTIAPFYGPLGSVHGVVRKATAAALATILKEQPGEVAAVTQSVIAQYHEAMIIPEPELDRLGNVVGEAWSDPWFVRAGLASLLDTVAPLVDTEVVPSIFRFFVQSALGDPDERVHESVLAAAINLSKEKGKDAVEVCLPIFEHFLETAERQRVADVVRTSCVILLGALAKHLAKENPKIPSIVDTLLAALSTPSEAVQVAVGECISPLVAAIKPQAPAMIETLMELLLEHDSYGVRRGAAHGLAGVVKGLGILALKQQGITDKLKAAIENKKNGRWREGALMAYEMLCGRLGRLFEPYVVHILPNLLICFGDGVKDVRIAANETAAQIMAKLSSHGVKLVLPHLLKALDDMQWRTKQGSVQLLGVMSSCAPKQLSTCLPSIVPPLAKMLTDSHAKVQEAAKESLDKIGAVIRNPEIQAITDKLLLAINYPNQHTNSCLQTLLETAFVHVIDAPSLALIMPILERAISDRTSTSTKKMASQIIGNMYSLTDPKDLGPYLPQVLPGIKEALIDPEPSVRGIAAKALGSMMKGMGEDTFPDLVPWLLSTLKADGSSVDRSGAAQGTAEVLFSLGVEKLDALFPEFVQGTNHQFAHVREGHMLMFVYLPVTFQEAFMPYVERVIPCVLSGIADIEEGVRSTSMRAGTGIITNFADVAIDLLLPELEAGILDENWRIRESSVSLLGELLYKLSGQTGKKSTTGGGEDENYGTEASTNLILEKLGQERNDRVLAGLYMCRQDTAVFVRQAAAHVWKVVVEHTIKTVKQVMAPLISLLLPCLASEEREARITAARTLGEVVRKLGQKVLPQIFPILTSGMESENPLQRQGVSVGLCEIMSASNHEVIVEFVDQIIPLVQKGLCDEDEGVRETTASTFAQLHIILGQDAITEIIPQLLNQLDAEETKEQALDGLRHIMASKSRVVLPFLIPRLSESPFTVDNAKSLVSLASVAGADLNRYVSGILATFLKAVVDPEIESASEILTAAQSLALAVDDEGLVDLLVGLTEAVQDKNALVRRAAISMIAELSRNGEQDLDDHMPDLIEIQLKAFTDESSDVVSEAWGGLNAVMERVKTDTAAYLNHILGVLTEMWAENPGADVAGFCMPKGIQPVFTLMHTSLISGTPEAKRTAAKTVAQVVKMTSAAALAPFILKLTGGLIRATSDNAGGIKASMLTGLHALLIKVPAKLKSMLPQLQPTCVKNLRDPSHDVRKAAAGVLDKLVPMQKRIDPLLTELLSGLGSAEESCISAYMQALCSTASKGGALASVDVRANVIAAMSEYLDDETDGFRVGAARVMAAIMKHLEEEAFDSLLVEKVLTEEPGVAWQANAGRASIMHNLFMEAPEKVLGEKHGSAMVNALARLVVSDNTSVSGYALSAGGVALSCLPTAPEPVAKIREMVTQFLIFSSDTSGDVVAMACEGFSDVGKQEAAVADEALAVMVPIMLKVANHKSFAAQHGGADALCRLFRLHESTAMQDGYAAKLPAADKKKFEAFCESKLAPRVLELTPQ
jgi:HEAT repeat protein